MIPYVLTASEDEEGLARATPDIGSLRVAKVYAEALLNAAEQAGQVGEVLDEFAAMTEAASVPRSELRQFFASGVIGRRTRDEVLQKVFDDRLHPLLFNLLRVVNDHDRMPLLPTILFEARKLQDQRANRLPVHVSTAVPLADDQRDRIQQLLRQVLHLEPVVEATVEPELLGGMRLRIGDHVFDGTVRTKLNQLREQLISRSSHEIQSGRNRFSSPE